MKVLIVGLGSIARRHVDAIRTILPEARIHALRSGTSSAGIDGVADIESWGNVPTDLDFIVISNPTACHFDTISQALVFQVPLFIEKPPLMNLEGADTLVARIREHSIPTYIACNLRFHPVIDWLKENLKNKRPLEVQAYCGSNLAEWRQQQDYRLSYSARATEGGGVHLDLIHELDYLLWLFGSPLTSTAMTARISTLDIDSADSAHYWLTYLGMRVSVLLNYFRADPKRTLEIVMPEETWTADLLAGTILCSAGTEIFRDTQTTDVSYRRQMEYFIRCIRTGSKPMNGLEESLETLKICLGHHE
jgi:predicted dehydrogenase